MKAFEKIIGYSAVKTELERLADILVSPEKYAKLGVTTPAGLLLYGVPGVGKTTMAESFIEATGRNCIVCRKNLPDGDFVKEIVRAFKTAEEQAPSVIFLDDLDKFANGDERHCDNEEYVTVQACIDELRGKPVFVLATANNIEKLPDSLLRSGRFDKLVEVDVPDGKDAEEITAHYLSDKHVAEDVEAKLIAGIMHGRSCAELEAVVNEAGIYAAFNGKSEIGNDELVEACLRLIYNVPEKGREVNRFALERIACHEAGHAVLQELFEPGSVCVVSARSEDGGIGGVTVAKPLKNYHFSKADKEKQIMIPLGGKAATELMFCDADVGEIEDVERASRIVSKLITDFCTYGFQFTQDRCNRFVSDALVAKREALIQNELERLYQQAKKLLTENRAFFDSVIELLVEKKTLLGTELQTIRKSVENHAA